MRGTLGVVVPAAGLGERMGGRPKAFLELGGTSLLERALTPFLEEPRVRSVVVALAPDDPGAPPDWLRELAPRVGVVPGGTTRTLSVFNCLEALDPDVDRVLVHDAARPFVTRAIIDRCVAAVTDQEGVAVGWPVADTIKEVAEDRRVIATPDRAGLWAAQTPQGFPRSKLVEAYRRAVSEGVSATDDAEVFSRFGGSVRMVEGSRWNLKITHPEDLEIAELLCGRVPEKDSVATNASTVESDRRIPG